MMIIKNNHFILEKMDEYDSKELREVQKKLSIISEAFEKEYGPFKQTKEKI